MGGVAGHMDHLYDNPELTFSKMKEIIDAAANGELSTEEKVDGQNLFLSYSIPDGQVKGARNKGNLKDGGMDATTLATKFAGRGGLETAFNKGFQAFEDAVGALSDSEKEKIFGPDTNVWYNAEIMYPGSGDKDDPGSVNVIKYDDNTLKIHNVGHFIFDRETAEQTPINPNSLRVLDNSLERMQQKLHGSDFKLARQAIIQLQKIEDEKISNEAKKKIDQTVRQQGLSDDSTVGDYMFKRVLNGISGDLSEELRKELTSYLLKLPGNVGLRAIKKGLSPSSLQDLQEVIRNKKNILKEAVYPLEMIIHNFTVEVLKGVESVFIADNTAEVARLRKELSIAVKQLTEQGPQDPEAMEIMKYHLNKIKDYSNITTPVEAVVFDYDGHTYKFAGNFSPINQILGMFKYPKTPRQVTNESTSYDLQVVTEDTGKKVALLPGGFKPPHAGHYKLAKELSSLPDIDEVVVIVGKNPRFSNIEPKITVTAEQSKRLWDIYTKDDGNIKVRIQEGKTPVSDVYDLIADKNSFSSGDTVVLGKSDKDEGDKRYARAQSWAERYNPGVSVDEMVMPVYGGEGMGGTTLRDLIAVGNKNKLLSKLPTHLSDKEKEDAYAIMTSRTESLDRFIDSAIEEISTMSSGAVEGGASTFGVGPPNQYNPWKKRKTSKKPQVRRAKRQRRR